VTFPATTTITRLLFLDHNWKQFTVKHDLAGVFTDFTTVVGLDGALGGGITETTFADDTAYYEFDSVTTTRIQITVKKTQTTDAEKFISQIIATKELGTFVGFPIVDRLTMSRNSRSKKVLSGKSLVQKSEESNNFQLRFKNYAVGLTFTADMSLMYTLFDRENNFLVWLSGGRRGTDFFRFTLRPFELKQVFQMQIDRDIRQSYSKNVYINAANLRVRLVEAV